MNNTNKTAYVYWLKGPQGQLMHCCDVTKESIVINKVDVVDEDWVKLVESEVKELVEDSFLNGKIIHRVSE